MNPDESVVYEFLMNNFDGDVIFQPIPNSTPDFVVKSFFAVEVRRLNLQFFNSEKTEGLESISIPLNSAFKEVLSSFDAEFFGKSFFVSYDYQRPLNKNFQKIKNEIELALRGFLIIQEPDYPCSISVNKEISININPSQPVRGRVFIPGGKIDKDVNGWIISQYIDNIQFCINDKSLKVSHHLNQYFEWWLYLVDHIGWGLDTNDIEEVKSSLSGKGNFNQVIILNTSGKKLLAYMR